MRYIRYMKDDIVWCDLIWCDIWDMLWFDIWCDVIWCMMWCDVIWYDMIWYDMENRHILTPLQRKCHTIIFRTMIDICLYFRYILCSYCLYNPSFIYLRNPVVDFYSKLRMRNRCCSASVISRIGKLSGLETRIDLGSHKEHRNITIWL